MSVEARRLAQELADAERRLRALERAPQLTNSTIHETALLAYDVRGNLRQVIGRQPDDRYTITDHGGPPPPVPSAPVCEIMLGGASVIWDGKFAEGIRRDESWGPQERPADVKYVEVHAAPVPDFIPTNVTQVGIIESKHGGRVFVPLIADVESYVVLVTVSSSYVESAPSAVTSVTALPDHYARFMQDTLVVTEVATEHQIPLSYQPTGGSEHVYWNRVYQPENRWVRAGGAIIVPDDGGLIRPGDLLTVEYAHAGRGPGPVVPPPLYTTDEPLNFRGATTADVATTETGTITRTLGMPSGTRSDAPPDLLVLCANGSDGWGITCEDDRFTKVADVMAGGGVWVGRATSLASVDVKFTGSGVWGGVVLAAYGANLDTRLEQAYYQYRPPQAPGLPGQGSGAILCMGTIYDTGGSSPWPPTIEGYTVAGRMGTYHEALIAHTEAGVVGPAAISWPSNSTSGNIVVLGVRGGVAA